VTTTSTDPAAVQRPAVRLPLRAIGDLADTYDAASLTAMQDDAQELARRGGPGAGGWQSLADALGAACAIVEHERRPRA
jgi:hypothetical protein